MHKIVDSELLIEIRRRLPSEVRGETRKLYEWKLFNTAFGSRDLLKSGLAVNSDAAFEDAVAAKKEILVAEGTYVDPDATEIKIGGAN